MLRYVIGDFKTDFELPDTDIPGSKLFSIG